MKNIGLEWAPLELSLDDFDMLYYLLTIYSLANFLIYYSDNTMFSSCKSTEKFHFFGFKYVRKCRNATTIADKNS